MACRKPVCKKCYEEKVESVLKQCDHGGKKVAAVPSGCVYLNPYARPSPSLPSRYRGPFKLCRHHRSCRFGQGCSYAHSEQECIVWNATIGQPGIHKGVCANCLKSYLQKVQKLQKVICLSDHFSVNGFRDSFLWTEEIADGVLPQLAVDSVAIVRSLPSNVAMMKEKGFQYKFRHSFYNCRFSNFSLGCFHPHNPAEEDQWNYWKSSPEGWTPVKLHDSAVATFQRKIVQAIQRAQPAPRIQPQSHSKYNRSFSDKPVPIAELGSLKASNYKDWFHTLLYLEERSIEKELREKRLKCFAVKDFEKKESREYGFAIISYTCVLVMPNEEAEFLKMHAPQLSMRPLPTVPHDLSCDVTTTGPVQGGLAVELKPNKSTLQLVEKMQLVSGSKDYSLWKRRHDAVEETSENTIKALLPEFADFATNFADRPVFQKELYEANHVRHEGLLQLDQIFQQEAADAILSSPPGPPFLLTGPFGTGKTRLIARLTHQILHTVPGSRVLISVHHQQTADSYFWSFFSKMKRYPLPCSCPVYRLVPETKKQLNTQPRVGYFVYTAEEMKENIGRNDLVRLVITTNNMALQLVRKERVALKTGHFTHIFVDEAAQCIEPEALMPLRVAGPETRVILAGDHLQVGPEDDVLSPEAARHGLTKSLLTRLHNRYTSLGSNMTSSTSSSSSNEVSVESPLVRKFTASLLTNYRCSANILRLPSNLFYECSLLARAQHELHPSTNSSLVFACTSLADRPSNQEADIRSMTEFAREILGLWPQQWNEFGSKKDLCFMASTHQQLSSMKKHLSQSGIPDQRDILLRSTHSIQGQEFTVVFLLTTNPPSVAQSSQSSIGGRSSIVSKRVFNTVLTRARTLFVAFGNPFTLLQMESGAPEGASCWKEYLRRCIEGSSIRLPPDCTAEQRRRLLEKVFDNHDPLGRTVRDTKDSILDTYSWQFLRKLDFVGGTWKIPKLDADDAADNDGYDSHNIGESADSWTLQCTSAHQALAIPRHVGGVQYTIEGLRSRGRALNGAQVVVEKIHGSLGRVVSIVKESEVKLFLCRIDTFNSSLFVPLNGKGPKLANLPAVSRKLIQIDKAQDEFTSTHTGRAVFKKYPIACYAIGGLEQTPPIPKLRDLIPLETAKNLVFVVRYIEWREGSVYPTAAVVGTFPIAHTEFHGNRLIRAIGEGPSHHEEIEATRRSMDLAQKCFQSSQFYPEALVSKAEGKSFFLDLLPDPRPCPPLEASQPAFRVGCDKSSERLHVSWRFKMCSTRKPEGILEELSEQVVFGEPPKDLPDAILITLVVTKTTSKESLVIKAWTQPSPPKNSPATLFKPDFKNMEVSLYSFSIKCSVSVGQVLPVWVGANTGGLVIQPEVQMVRPAPYLCLCMQHSTRPAQCFSSPVLHNASVERYQDAEEYVRLWESALLAEAAESSVKDGELLFIDQATLMWKDEFFKEVTDLLKEPSFVYDGEVTLWLDKNFVTRSGRFVQFNTGDFVCARYSGEKAAVYHFVVQSVQSVKSSSDQEEGAQLISMKMVGERNSVVSHAMRPLLRRSSCSVQIIPCMIPQRRMYEALLRLKSSGSSSFVQKVIACGHVNLAEPKHLRTIMERDYVRSSTLFTKLWSGSGSLNKKQIEAMQKAFEYKFSLIQGPPGTGKSVTGAHLAYTFAKYNRDRLRDGSSCVLYCAPSNKATDVVLGYLHQLITRCKSTVKVLRIYSRGMEHQTKGAGPKMNPEVFKQIITEKCPKDFLTYSLHHKVLKTEYGPEIKALEESFKRSKSAGQIPSARDEKKYRRLISAGEREVFEKEKFDIVLCTCNEAASFRAKRNLVVRQCIVDECGYAVEPDAMIPLQLCQHAVLIGDHRQLQPVIKNSIAGDNGLNRSLFERYADMYAKAKARLKCGDEFTAFTQLQEQYRMHTAICQPPSELFYNKTLTTAPSVTAEWHSFLRRATPRFQSPFPDRHRPVMFLDIQGREDSPRASASAQGGGPESKRNSEEADAVVDLVRRFVDGLAPLPADSGTDDLVVLTPYLGQKDCIGRKLQDWGLKDRVPVKTVNESQGSEANVVIFSTVRSMHARDFDPELLRGDIGWAKEHLGFVTDPHQICVAISRARFGFIVVGNGKLLTCDHTWNNLICHHFKKNGCYSAARP